MAQNHRVVNIDLDTGEIKDGVNVYVAKKHYYNQNHLTMFQEALNTIAKSDIRGEDMKVFMFILAKAGMGNKVFFVFKEAAEELGMDSGNFSRSIRRLEKRNIIIKGEEKMGRTQSIRVNYGVAWKGKIKEHNVVKMYDSHRPILDKEPEGRNLFNQD